MVGLALLGLAGVAAAADDKKDKDTPKLSVGDDAPALKASKWLQGDEVKKFEKDHVYVVEFWATWCGPCIAMMPHVAEMQEQFKKDVTFIGFSSKDDDGNDETKVTEFVKKRGKKLKYTFAFEEERDTNDAYMKASGQGGIPCSFVIDKAGKIAFIGHPMYLDVVLPKVVSGKWDAKEGRDEIKGLEKEVNGVFLALRGRDAEAALEKLAEFEKKHPEMKKVPYFVGPKLGLLIRAKKPDEAKKLAKQILEAAAKYDDTNAMFSVSASLRTAKDDKDLLALAIEAAETMLKAAGEKDLRALFCMAEAQFAGGDKEKAKQYLKKAIDAAEQAGDKEFLEKRLKQYDETKKDE